ncbi:MAG: UDP binding domain-containing protein, partial [Cetobacterium sp.]
KEMINEGKVIKGGKVLILGLTFKEDCPDLRNSKVIDVINELKEYKLEVMVCDPVADKAEAIEEYGIQLCRIEEVKNIDAIIVAVKHKEFTVLKRENLMKLYDIREEKPLILDLKGVFNKKDMLENFRYWRM